MSKFTLSDAGAKLSGRSGILELMDDLGRALTTQPDMRMMGGGNPAHIPAVQEIWRQRMREMLDKGGEFDRMLANYDSPRGNPRFIKALADFLRRECGWQVGPENIAITSGGQTAFFFLFNLLAGKQGAVSRKILLPLVPEYIGYENQGIGEGMFHACRPEIELLEDGLFKYRVNFAAVEKALEGDIAAVCVSRPTNPSGNVLTDEEVLHLASLARSRGIPLIIDNAYGLPFPGAIYTEAQPVWDDSMILTLSLSKLGLPGTRTGIVVAAPEIADAVAAMTAVAGLANGNLGQALTCQLLETGEMRRVSRELIRPFYEERATLAQRWAREAFGATPVRMHRAEGAFFLWMWFPGLPISSRELYERLKARKVLVVPGEYFFFGMEASPEPWAHAHECIRVTFSQSEEIVREGLEIIAEVVTGAWSGGAALGGSSQR